MYLITKTNIYIYIYIVELPVYWKAKIALGKVASYRWSTAPAYKDGWNTFSVVLR